MGGILSSPDPAPLPPPITEEAGRTSSKRERRRILSSKTQTSYASNENTGASGLKTILGG